MLGPVHTDLDKFENGVFATIALQMFFIDIFLLVLLVLPVSTLIRINLKHVHTSVVVRIFKEFRFRFSEQHRLQNFVLLFVFF